MSPYDWGAARAVLFDLDGTLIDSAPDLGRAANRLRTDRGLAPLPLRQYRCMAGAGARGMLAVAFGMAPEHPEFALLREEFLDAYERCIHDHTQAFDQVEELIARLEGAALPWGVVTNKHHRFTSLIVQRMPLFANAAAVVSGDTTPHAKPHPAPLLEAAARLNIPSQGCIYMGDDLRDIQAGRAAGMGTVAALYGYLGKDADATTWGAHATIEKPLELLKLLSLP